MSNDHIVGVGPTPEAATADALRRVEPGHRVVESRGPVREGKEWTYTIRTAKEAQGE